MAMGIGDVLIEPMAQPIKGFPKAACGSPGRPSGTDLSTCESEMSLHRVLAKQSPDLYQALCENGKAPALVLDSKRNRSKSRHYQTQSRRTSVEEKVEEEDALNKYKLRERLGDGSMCTVHRARDKFSNVEVAMKATRDTSIEAIGAMQREFNILRRFDNPHIVKALDLLHLVDMTVLVLEYCPGFQLQQVVAHAPEKHLQEVVARPLSVALLEGVSCLHKLHLAHGDLKPQNVIVSSNMKDLRLVDFGSVREIHHTVGKQISETEHRCTLLLPRVDLYDAPEVLLGEKPSEASDVWQVGLCVYLMLSGKLPQKRDHCVRGSLLTVARKHVSLKGDHWRHVSSGCRSGLQRCLAIDKCERPAAFEMLKDCSSHDVRHTSPADSPLLQGLVQVDKNAEGDLDLGGLPLAFQTKSNRSTVTSQGTSRWNVDLRHDFEPAVRELEVRSNTGSKGSSCSKACSNVGHTGSKCSQESVLEPSSEVIVKGSNSERASVLVVFPSEGTCKVRMSDGSIKVVRISDVTYLY